MEYSDDIVALAKNISLTKSTKSSMRFWILFLEAFWIYLCIIFESFWSHFGIIFSFFCIKKAKS